MKTTDAMNGCLKDRIKICNQMINAYNTDLAGLEQNIAKTNTEIEKTKDLFKRRLRAVQMSGDTAWTVLVLGSDNLSDFLEKSQLIKTINSYDRKLVSELTESIKSLEKDKENIERKQEEQRKISKELESAQGTYTDLLQSAKDKVSDTNADIRQQNQLLKEAEAAERELEASIREAAEKDKGIVFTSISFAWPVKNYTYISSPYGYRIHPIYGTKKMHSGIDIAGSGISGKPVLASADGVVGLAKYGSSYGNHVIINHGKATNGNSYQTLYAHMTRYVVSVGQAVKKGDVIGYVGSTGASTGPHLHFELRIKKSGGSTYNHTNPLNYVSKRS